MAEWPLVSGAVNESKPSPEDALAYLPCSSIQQFPKGAQIYGPDEISTSLFLVIDGRVKLSRLNEFGVAVVVDLYHADDFFGESALLRTAHPEEQAVALEPTKVMTWTADEIERLMAKEPRLAIALMQGVVKRCVDFKERLESFAMEGTANRLARALLHFGEKFSQEPEDGTVTIPPLTHELLAQYVGTSREIISHHMSEFRAGGYIRYSRKGITIHREPFRGWLRNRVKGAT